MKKRDFVICAFLLMFSTDLLKAEPIATAKETPFTSSAFLIKESIALTETMAKLAASDAYVSAMTQSPDIKTYTAEIGRGVYNTPTGIYFLSLSPEKTEKLMQLSMSVDLNQLEPLIRQTFLEKISGFMFAKMLNGQSGPGFLAATAIIETTKSYVEPQDWEGAFSILLTYDGNYASLTSFRQSGDDVISAQATFIKQNAHMLENLAQNNDPFAYATGENFFSVIVK